MRKWTASTLNEVSNLPATPLPEFSVHPVSGPAGRFRLALAGRLPDAWPSRLSHHMRQAGLDVHQVLAARDANGKWHAELDGSAEDVDPNTLPWQEWMTRDPRGFPRWSPTLTSFRLVDSASHGGSIELYVEGIDVRGFLSGLLRPIHQLALMPVALDIRTEGGRCRNRIWLREQGDSSVTSGARSRLQISLALAVKRSIARATAALPAA